MIQPPAVPGCWVPEDRAWSPQPQGQVHTAGLRKKQHKPSGITPPTRPCPHLQDATGHIPSTQTTEWRRGLGHTCCAQLYWIVLAMPLGLALPAPLPSPLQSFQGTAALCCPCLEPPVQSSPVWSPAQQRVPPPSHPPGGSACCSPRYGSSSRDRRDSSRWLSMTFSCWMSAQALAGFRVFRDCSEHVEIRDAWLSSCMWAARVLSGERGA